MSYFITRIFCYLTMTTNYPSIYIDKQRKLDQLVKRIKPLKEIYFDMEVDNMYHYGTTISLIQLLVDETAYLIDVISDINLKGLLAALKPKLIVVHGSDFDLRMLHQKFDFAPSHIFDTMIAAQLAGKKAFGLAALVEQYFNVKLDKKYQRADWSIRPISEEMLYYAAKDTFFLPELKENLSRELSDLGRLSWQQEWCDHLIEVAQYYQKPDKETVWRIKGSHRFSSRQLNVLKEVWNWRDQQAKENNKPVHKIFNTKAMLHMISLIPSNQGKYITWEKLPLKTQSVLKTSLLETIIHAEKIPPENWPKRIKSTSHKTSSPDPKVVTILKETRDKIARKLNLPASLLASKDSIGHFAQLAKRSPKNINNGTSLMNWQKALLSKPWIEALSSK
ncbi:MAG: HRDC domain-containing protein [Fibrobacteria bacterium]|nr:HRDC domain-containing protein [Fibrobacteria bacterium]